MKQRSVTTQWSENCVGI